ncbi:acyltransferase 3 [Acidovorax delafieldii 2AN]|uniref:Acyltransferase 3 n=1 Tax=Acidovorax delafieldii 2AN TaxID=573060 RepID=C5T0P2_ACIDE|nr:acyltransferase family protein [Acidovorax delafieldii]EER61947.1 acyltransferase 3 [Acidovorax delafieldii 2AN]
MRHYPNFDWLRLFFAVQVVAMHSGAWERVLINPVPAFIAVSGFVVLGSIERRSLTSFFLSRALRVLPLLFVSFLVIGAIFGASEMRQTFLFWLWPMGPAPLNAVVWTLIYEEVLYVCMAILFVFGFYRRPLLIAVAFIGSLYFARNPPPFLYPVTYVLISSFLLGSVAYLYRHWIVRLPSMVAIGWFVLGMAGVATLKYSMGSWVDDFFVHLIAIAGALCFAIAGPQLPRLALDLSYSLYLFHLLSRALLMHFIPLGVPLFMAMLATTIPVCVVAWYGIERPFLSLRDRLFFRRLPARYPS